MYFGDQNFFQNLFENTQCKNCGIPTLVKFYQRVFIYSTSLLTHVQSDVFEFRTIKSFKNI